MSGNRGRRGFTLVEVLVAGMLLAILAGMFIGFMRMHNDALKEGTAGAKMQFQSDLVSAEMARRIRAASLVFAADEGWMPEPALSVRDTTWIVLYDTSGAVTGAYKVDGGVLKESDDNAVFRPFLAGSDTVRVAQGSGFRLSAARKSVTLNLRISIHYKNRDYENPAKGDMYACRN